MSDGGKGSSPRPFGVDQNTFQSNWEKTFGKKTPQERDDAQAEDAEFERIKREFDEKVIMKPDFSE
jgi:hypothetical protein